MGTYRNISDLCIRCTDAHKRYEGNEAIYEEYRTINSQIRRAIINNLECDFTKQQWDECRKYFDYKCAYCGCKVKLAQEHFIPVKKGGNYTKSNILPACKSCNSSKSDKDFFFWYPRYKFYAKYREIKVLEYLLFCSEIL